MFDYVEKRMDICKQCPKRVIKERPYLEPLPESMKEKMKWSCDNCGCILENITKLPFKKCPDGKW